MTDEKIFVVQIAGHEIELTLAELADLHEVVTANICEIFREYEQKQDASDEFDMHMVVSTELQ